ncbi:MAG: DUF2384 domain-containing protein [Flavobacteriaceae bacterium]|nr:DUF2384 domain-containing protein [Flavobacteriaceae bacterium]
MVAIETRHLKILQEIPDKINDIDILLYLQGKKINWEYVQTLKRITDFNDEVLSSWLNVSVKTFRSYKKPDQEINVNIKEHVLVLLSLMQHGKAVFNSVHKFEEWLKTQNFYFDGEMPIGFLKTITGIRFVNDRLTALEYGDNV